MYFSTMSYLLFLYKVIRKIVNETYLDSAESIIGILISEFPKKSINDVNNTQVT